jgi:hypothetical protein
MSLSLIVSHAQQPQFHPNPKGTKMKNFLKHAELVGLMNACIELVITWFGSTEMHYDDAGCLHSTSWPMDA